MTAVIDGRYILGEQPSDLVCFLGDEESSTRTWIIRVEQQERGQRGRNNRVDLVHFQC